MIDVGNVFAFLCILAKGKGITFYFRDFRDEKKFLSFKRVDFKGEKDYMLKLRFGFNRVDFKDIYWKVGVSLGVVYKISIQTIHWIYWSGRIWHRWVWN